MESVYQNIYQSTYFSKLPVVMASENEMEDFILLHDGWALFNGERIIALHTHTNASSTQLDAMYVLIKTIHYCYSDFIKKVANEVTIIIKKMFDLPEIQNFVQNEISFESVVKEIYDEITYDIIFDEFIINCQEIVQHWILYMDRNPVKHYKNEEHFQMVISYLQKNKDQMILLFEKMYHMYREEAGKLLPIGNYIISLCTKPVLTLGEITVLEKFIAENSSKVISPMEDPITKDYLENMQCTSKFRLPMFHYLNQNGKIESRASHYDYGREECINSTLKLIGYQVKMEKTFIHTIVDCFVEHGFADKKTIMNTIQFILATERNTIGYTNKYDTMTLYDHYNLVSIANDNNIPYEICMESTSLFLSPLEFLTEILLRILSRVYNVNIMFYSTQLVPLFIDNALSFDVPVITIYQYTGDLNYNIYPLGTTFQPLAQTKEVNDSAPVNDIEDIVDV